MQPRIESCKEKKLIGKRIEMSFANNTTFQLWHSFMPRRKEILNAVGNDRYSVQIYAPTFFSAFDPNAAFEKWAAIEVSDFENSVAGMEHFVIPSGRYAVFTYKGLPAAAETFFTAIFTAWLPDSEYELDDRPHFEILGAQYSNNSPDSEEEVWIPVKFKN